VVREGEVTPLFVARKQTGFPPYAEEVGHLVDGADPLLRDPALTASLRAAHAGLGVRDGWTHSEWMLTASGPALIEVNGRLGGDLIPYLGLLATGVDPGLVAAAAACGTSAATTPTRARCAGVRFFYADKPDSHLAAVEFDPGALPVAIDRAEVLARPGTVASPPPKGSAYDRIAYAVAVADTPARCGAELDAAEAALRVTLSA
jgi:hypothetical protein